MPDMPMAAALKALRKERGLSQPRLAEVIRDHGQGPSQGLIAQVETNRRNLSEQYVDDLADALDLSRVERARLHSARREQLAESLDTGTAARLEAVEHRLAELERDRDEMVRWRAQFMDDDAPAAELHESNVHQLPAAASKGRPSTKGRSARRPTDVPLEPEGP